MFEAKLVNFPGDLYNPFSIPYGFTNIADYLAVAGVRQSAQTMSTAYMG
jgi:hypothetical protein